MAKKKLCLKNKLFMLHLLFSCNLITWGNRSNILTVTEIQYKRGCIIGEWHTLLNVQSH